MSDALVLVVDDDAANRASVLKSLEREGLRVLAAAEGREALAVLRRERVAVLLTDLMMPGVDGLELLKAARLTSPSTSVVLMTAYGTVEMAVTAMRLTSSSRCSAAFRSAFSPRTAR